MALHQCDLFRGRRPADHLSSLSDARIGRLSCARRLRVDREYRVLLTASGPRFVCKDIGSGAVAARRVGNVFYNRGFADVFLRHPMQTARSHAQDDEPFAVRHPTARLPARSHCSWSTRRRCCPWQRTSSVVPDVSAWKSALLDGLRSADGFHLLSVDGTLKMAHGCPPARRGDALFAWQLTAGPRADNAYVARCCLGPCRGPQRQQPPYCRVRPGERGAPRRSGGCALGSRGQRIAGDAHRPVVVVSISSERRAGHVPHPGEPVQRAPGCSVGLSASSTCPALRRPARTWTRFKPFEANGTGSSPVARCSSTTICVARHWPGRTVRSCTRALPPTGPAYAHLLFFLEMRVMANVVGSLKENRTTARPGSSRPRGLPPASADPDRAPTLRR